MNLSFRCAIVTGAVAAFCVLSASAAKAQHVSAPAPLNWSGFYIGGHLGATTTRADSSIEWGPGDFLNPASPAAQSIVAAGYQTYHSRSGFTGGFQGGYNYQIGPALLGVEADVAWIDGAFAKSISGRPADNPTILYTLGYQTQIDSMATVRGRLGYAWDRLLVYGTAGIAVADIKFSWSYRDNTPASGSGQTRETATAPVFGGGLEYALPSNWSAKIEYLYAKFGSRTATGSLGQPGFINAITGHSGDLPIYSVRAGFNYHF